MHAVYREFSDKPERYAWLNAQLDAVLEEAEDLTAALSNASALLYLLLPRLNWAGFYLLRGDHLSLGPFQGNPAVARIEIGAGVCGTAAAERAPQIVADVHACANHIACDAASASEIVVPIHVRSALLGVIDIDSPFPANFDAQDLAGLETFSAKIAAFAEAKGA